MPLIASDIISQSRVSGATARENDDHFLKTQDPGVSLEIISHLVSASASLSESFVRGEGMHVPEFAYYTQLLPTVFNHVLETANGGSGEWGKIEIINVM